MRQKNSNHLWRLNPFNLMIVQLPDELGTTIVKAWILERLGRRVDRLAAGDGTETDTGQ